MLGRTQDPTKKIYAQAASNVCWSSRCHLSSEMYTTGLCIAAGGLAKQDEPARRSQDIPHLPVLGVLPAEDGSAAGVFSSKQQQQQRRKHKINRRWQRRRQQRRSRQHTAGSLSPRLLLRKHTCNVQLLCRYSQHAGVAPSLLASVAITLHDSQHCDTEDIAMPTALRVALWLHCSATQAAALAVRH